MDSNIEKTFEFDKKYKFKLKYINLKKIKFDSVGIK